MEGGHMLNLSIDYGLCTGCGACAEVYPMIFETRDDKAWIIDYTKFRVNEHQDLSTVCPYRAISIE
jgi:ferredoxin